MALKSYKPITPSLRQLVIVDREGLWKGKPVKALVEGQNNIPEFDGRNSTIEVIHFMKRGSVSVGADTWNTCMNRGRRHR